MKKNYLKLFIFLFFIVSCSSNQTTDVSETPDIIENASETVITNPSTDTTTTTSTILIEDKCLEDNNQNINFENIENVQNFLNRYGFDAGDEDGYFGEQTANAVRKFQAFAGLNPDGDVGPNTIEIMRNWTGCEERLGTYSPNSITNTTTTTIVPDTTTTTIVSDTTTTTVPVNVNTYETINNGIVPGISLTTNEVISIFKGVNNGESVCGTPYLQNIDSNVINYYSNGLLPKDFKTQNSIFSESVHTTEIVEESSNQIRIKIFGDGGTGYKFYFIEPFTSNLINLSPDELITSLNLTEAVFNLENLTSGYWFYSFAESNNGKVVKSSGNREFLVGDTLTQSVSSHDGIGKLIITSPDSSSGKNLNVTSGQSFDTNSSISIVYLTNQVLDNRESLTEEIKIDDSIISLKDENQAFESEILLIGTELIKIVNKNGNDFGVIRGYLNTEIKSYQVGAEIKAIKNLDKENIISNFAYVIFRNEKGMKFQVPLGEELIPSVFNFKTCNYDRYSLEQITTFSWRSSGKSTVDSVSLVDSLNPLFDKVFVINSGGQNYTPPSINPTDEVSGEFINTGPKSLSVIEGDNISFNFNGIIDGSSKTQFVKFKFRMSPDSGSSKKTKYKYVYMPVIDNSFNFNLAISKVSSNESNLSDIWESEYIYIFESITLYDLSTSVEFKNNGTVKYDYKSELGSHQVYYLDQFSFIVKNQ